MKLVILCTSHSEGLYPVNERIPDGMLRIFGKPLAALMLENANLESYSNVYILCRSLPDRLEGCFEGTKAEVITAKGSLYDELSRLCGGEDMLICSARYVFFCDFDRVTEEYERSGADGLVCAVKNKDGVRGCKLYAESGMLTRVYCDIYDEAEDYDGCFAGVAVISHGLLERLESRSFSSAEELVKICAEESEKIAVHYAEGLFYTLDTPDSFRKAVLSLLSVGRVPKTAIELSEGVYSEEEISLSGITLIKPVYIGKGVTLEKGIVLENCSVGDSCVIGARNVIKNSIIGESCRIGANAEADGCVVCGGAVIRSAVQLCEGCAVGEKAIVGSASRLMPGVLVGAGKHTPSGEIINDDINCGCGCVSAIDDECCCGFSHNIASPDECARLAMAAGTAYSEGSTAVCGCVGDSGAKTLLEAFESGLVSTGINVISIGNSTPQEVMFLISRLGAQFGCCVNAGFSERIQLMSRGGLELPAEKCAAIERAAALKRFRLMPLDRYGEKYCMEDAKSLYKVFLTQILPKVFRGVNADVRCAALSQARLADKLVRPRNDIDGERIIFHISNDGRTCTAYTDPTGYVINEKLVLLAAKAAFEKEIPVSVPFTFPMAADKLAEMTGGKLYRYSHSAHEGEDMAARRVASRPDNFFVRDGMVLMCMICEYLTEHEITLAEALADIPKFYSSQRFAAVSCPPNEVYSRLSCRREGGADGVAFRNGVSRAVVRPLRHRQGLIIFAESVSAEAASEICDDILKKLK